jgi:hypothetical protein
MQRNLNSLLLRGLLGLALSLVAVAAAATQAIRFSGEVRLDAGRLVLVETPTEASCALTAEAAAPLGG